MRIDSLLVPDFPEQWTVYHAEWMQTVPDCYYVDSLDKKWGHIVGLSPFFTHRCQHQATTIHIYVAEKFVVINPIPETGISQEFTFNKIKAPNEDTNTTSKPLERV